MGSDNEKFFSNNITTDQCKDTGMAMVLIFLILTLFLKNPVYVYMAIGLHVLNMVAPKMFRPLAIVWLGLSRLLGTVMSRIILFIIFFGLVTPVGILRRVLSGDTMKLRAFKKGRESVMVVRNHTFSANDIERPY